MTPRKHVVIEFDRELAPMVSERRWHCSPGVDPLPDGGVCFSCDVAITPEFISWILSYGAHAVVVEPASLRDQILIEHTRAIERTMARHPPSPNTPRGWQDQSGPPAHNDETKHEMKADASNDIDDSTPRDQRTPASAPAKGHHTDRDDFDAPTLTDPLVEDLPRRARSKS